MSNPFSADSKDVDRTIVEAMVREYHDAEAKGTGLLLALAARVNDKLRPALLRELLLAEFQFRKSAGLPLEKTAYAAALAEYTAVVDEAWHLFRKSLRSPTAHDLVEERAGQTPAFQSMSASSTTASETSWPADYRPLRVLGEGTFGVVWLARDVALDKDVAIKFPKRTSGANLAYYIKEARAVAQLDHPNIVPVYRVFQSGDGEYCVVSKYIQGNDLAHYLKNNPLAHDAVARLVAKVADALQHAHNRGIFHRDIKPANILIDGGGEPFLTDFGLALRDEDIGHGATFAGTPCYMSPEQANGESHLVTGASDIFSLGVVLYELLTTTRPFHANDLQDLLHAVRFSEPKPLREQVPELPEELERICLRALAKHAADRYVCMADMAVDLRNWATAQQIAAEAKPAMLVPKGLRAFEGSDYSFFLDLLPGPRDREGLPESIRFWKARLESTDSAATFRVGLLYGPSGCGKSSLVRAGLIPSLADHVVVVCVDAAADSLEKQLLSALQRRIPDQPNGELNQVLSAIRRGRGIPASKKLVIVLDQFEQWLHASSVDSRDSIAQALRQCDGARIQALLLVRDDFWMGVTEFCKTLEVLLVENYNMASMSLFHPEHARKVLVELGRAHKRLPSPSEPLSPTQQIYVQQAIAGLGHALDNRVVPVQLALFADMMKDRTWNPDALREIGGAAGVGRTFLEETFDRPSARPEPRRHANAACEVLRALLPAGGVNIKLQHRTESDLRTASGYEDRPEEFSELLKVLDHDTRLITPVSSEETTPAYQLTHDYLVQSLREWILGRQGKTREGRAELRLEERAATWSSKTENRQLPSLLEYLNIVLFTERRRWTELQRRMMGKASRLHGWRCLAALAVMAAIVVMGIIVVRNEEETRVRGLVGQLLNAEPSRILEIIERIDNNPPVARSILSPKLNIDPRVPENRRQLLLARMALVRHDKSLVEPLFNAMLDESTVFAIPIRDLLQPASADQTKRLGEVLSSEQEAPRRRFHAGIALAEFSSNDSKIWTDSNIKFVADQLVSANPELQPLLRDALRRVKGLLLPHLERIYGNDESPMVQRISATNGMLDYARGERAKLTRMLAVASPEQHRILHPALAGDITHADVKVLEKFAEAQPPPVMGSRARIEFGKQRANAAVSLLRLGKRESVLPVFQMTDDPEALTQFIFRCRPRDVPIEALLDCLNLAGSAPAGKYPPHSRYALILALGEYQFDDIPERYRQEILKKLVAWYADDPSSGVHGATGWLLRQWGHGEVVRRIDQTPKPYSPDREWFTLQVRCEPSRRLSPDDANGDQSVTPADLAADKKQEIANHPPAKHYFTFVVFKPGTYKIGSPNDELDRSPQPMKETRHEVTITQTFAMLDREIAMGELCLFDGSYKMFKERLGIDDSCAGVGADWNDANAFAVWLSNAFRICRIAEVINSKGKVRANTASHENGRAFVDRGGQTKTSLFYLPTEAQWEIACRAGSRTSMSQGGDYSLLSKFGWHYGNRKRVQPSKLLRPNCVGLFDLHGNLSEWVYDFGEFYDSQPAVDPTGPKQGTLRLQRGGAFDVPAEGCRSAMRLTIGPENRNAASGFRLVVSIEELLAFEKSLEPEENR
jgi:serine/threonine protein kinase/formylglycine-generating enzyme required for sulfatase activity